eukprot:scaffold565_cov379-Pinguiococcus_pyrenoidosus.AAC.22
MHISAADLSLELPFNCLLMSDGNDLVRRPVPRMPLLQAVDAHPAAALGIELCAAVALGNCKSPATADPSRACEGFRLPRSCVLPAERVVIVELSDWHLRPGCPSRSFRKWR